MADLRFIGQDISAYGPQHLASVDTDVLLVSNINPVGVGTPLVITASTNFTPASAALRVSSNANDLLLLNSVASGGTGTGDVFVIGDNAGNALMTLADNGRLTLAGNAVVSGSGLSTVAGPISFNGNVTFGDTTGDDTVTFSRQWGNAGANSALDVSQVLSLAPVGTPPAATAHTKVTAGILLAAEGQAVSGSISADPGSLVLRTDGTAWINTGAVTGTTWTQLASAGGASLQTAYDAGQAISTTALGNPVAISSTGANTVLSADSSGGTGTSLSLLSSSGSSLLQATGGTLPALSLTGTNATGYALAPASAATAADMSITSGASSAGAGGAITISSGNGTGAAGAVGIQVGTGASAAISIGTANTATIAIGSSTNAATVYHSEVTGSAGDTSVALNVGSAAAANTAVGSYAIGVGAGDLTNIGAIANPNLQTTLAAIDSTIGTLSASSAHTLQKAYDGNAVILTAAGTPVVVNSAAGGTALSLISPSAADAITVAGGTLPVLSLSGTNGSGYALAPASAATAADLTLTSGAATGGVGGNIALAAGAGSGANAGGTVTISGGAGGTTSNISGGIQIFSSSSTAVLGSDVTSGFVGALSTATSTAGGGAGTITSGNVVLGSIVNAGGATGSGSSGDVMIYTLAETNDASTALGGILLLNAKTAGANPIPVASGAIDIKASDATGTISLVSGLDITLDARGAATAITVNQAGDTVLDGTFTATSIVGALNELKSAATTTTDLTVSLKADATTGVAAFDLVYVTADAAATPINDSRAFVADATASPNAVGFAATAAAADALFDTIISGEITLVDAKWDGGAPGLTNAGDTVYMSTTTAGRVTLTAPSASGDTLLPVGLVSFANATANTTRVIVRMGTPIAL